MNNDPTQPPHQDTPPNPPISHEKGAGSRAKATAKEQRAPNDQAESQKLDKAEKAAANPTQAARGDRPPAGV